VPGAAARAQAQELLELSFKVGEEGIVALDEDAALASEDIKAAAASIRSWRYIQVGASPSPVAQPLLLLLLLLAPGSLRRRAGRHGCWLGGSSSALGWYGGSSVLLGGQQGRACLALRGWASGRGCRWEDCVLERGRQQAMWCRRPQHTPPHSPAPPLTGPTGPPTPTTTRPQINTCQMLADVHRDAGDAAQAQALQAKLQRKSAELHDGVDAQHAAAAERLARLAGQVAERQQELEAGWDEAAAAGVPLALLGGASAAPWQACLAAGMQVRGCWAASGTYHLRQRFRLSPPPLPPPTRGILPLAPCVSVGAGSCSRPRPHPHPHLRWAAHLPTPHQNHPPPAAFLAPLAPQEAQEAEQQGRELKEDGDGGLQTTLMGTQVKRLLEGLEHDAAPARAALDGTLTLRWAAQRAGLRLGCGRQQQRQQRQAAGGRRQAAGGRRQAAGGRRQAAGRRPQAAGRRPQAAGRRPQAAAAVQRQAHRQRCGPRRCVPHVLGGGAWCPRWAERWRVVALAANPWEWEQPCPGAPGALAGMRSAQGSCSRRRWPACTTAPPSSLTATARYAAGPWHGLHRCC
jgi:6-phosphofructokinase 2